ncbi:centromeric adaptor, shugoshin Sgo2 [Schizosaccharomyces osmophilus]|uniref:Centromeric adaptor, shugoshin Sgo2 n=1 Tax=Schizosaccharomyces osmophilus TaxID=2545709 RepID=A0AAF0AX08_9SCHI|nr:centromeric adaptor, shugoshin Sgo2 [Schizosaccharomyces osmophilus]WBW73429.1 centromeric adaptor, shugoshin Sgo2 [Schizosaccharomyces osmophilus]
MSTASPSLSLEESKKKQLRQYKEIIRISKAQSARIKDLQLENERLLSENIDLRSVAINLEEQLESQQIKNEGLQEKVNSLLSKCQGEAETFIKSISQYRQDAQEFFQAWESQSTREVETDEEDLDEETFVKETEDILKEANEDVSIKNLSCLLDNSGNQNDHSINASKKASSSLTENHETNKEKEISEERSTGGPAEARSHNERREETRDSSNGRKSYQLISNGPKSVETNEINVHDDLHDQTIDLSSRTLNNINSRNSDIVPVNAERHMASSTPFNTTNEASVEAKLNRKSNASGPQVIGISNDTNPIQQQTKSRSLDQVSRAVEHQPSSPKQSDTPSTYPTNSEMIQNPEKSVSQSIPTPELYSHTADIKLQESHRVNTHPHSQVLPEKRKSSLSRLPANSDTSESDEPLSTLKNSNGRFSSEPPRNGGLVTSGDNSTASNPLWLQGILNNRASPNRVSSKKTPNSTHNQHNQESLYDNLQLLSTVTNLRFFETHAKDEKNIVKEKKEEPPLKKTKRGRPPGSTNKTVVPSSPEQQSRSASEELNDGRSRRERKRVNYALPGLRTKMRRDFNLPTDHSKPRKHRRAKTPEPMGEEPDS